MQWPMIYVLGVIQTATSYDIDLDAAQVFDTLIGTISHQVIRSAVTGQYQDVMDIG